MLSATPTRLLIAETTDTMNHAVTLAMLKDLLETSQAGQRGFALAAKDNREPGVLDVLTEGEESCRAATVELQDQVRILGGDPEDGGTVNAAVYRGWISFKAVAISRDTKLILEECERGEDYAKARYEDAMKIELSEPLRMILERQYRRVIAIHGRVLLLRNRYPAGDRVRAG
jgi:uncharacterized protein (TIGR02284 family)